MATMVNRDCWIIQGYKLVPGRITAQRFNPDQCDVLTADGHPTVDSRSVYLDHAEAQRIIDAADEANWQLLRQLGMRLGLHVERAQLVIVTAEAQYRIMAINVQDSYRRVTLHTLGNNVVAS